MSMLGSTESWREKWMLLVDLPTSSGPDTWKPMISKEDRCLRGHLGDLEEADDGEGTVGPPL